jgi:GT2 family glycosyltransferase
MLDKDPITANHPMTDLSIIIVNWNCMAFTEQCIASIYSTVNDVAYEVIVVDNASADSPCQSLTEKFPDVKLVLSDENIGFGRANNLGARLSLGKILFFLNPDTVLLGDAVHRMLDGLLARPQAGVIGCRLLNPDGSAQISVQKAPTIINQLFALEWLQRRWPSLPSQGKETPHSESAAALPKVDVVAGAGLMIRRNVFEKVEGFNPEYFMYAEEVELCDAVHRAGWELLHCSSAEVIHFGGQSTKKREDGFSDIAMLESVYRYLCHTRGHFYARLFRAALLLSAVVRGAVLALISPFAVTLNRPMTRDRLTRARRKWLRIGRWSVGAEKRIVVNGARGLAQGSVLES